MIYGNHGWDEARNLKSHWRGYLLAGKYAPAEGLGCNATDFRTVPLNGWSGVWQNKQEPSAVQASLLKTPPYQWWGPGVMSWAQGSVYTGGNHSGLVGRFDGAKGVMFFLNCPTVNLGVSDVPGSKLFTAPHRPGLKWSFSGDTFGPLVEHPMNCGFTDGSVKFVWNKGGWFDYNTVR